MADWLWLDDEPTDEELEEIEWEREVYPDGFCRVCGAPMSEDVTEFAECPNCGQKEWL